MTKIKPGVRKSRSTSLAKPGDNQRPAAKAAARSPKTRARAMAAGATPAQTQRPARETPDSSLTRMLDLLDLFTPAAPYWSAEELIRYTGASRSTIYRHVRALHGAGLIRPVANGNYIVGPRAIELDRQLRQTDPMYIASEGVLRRLMLATGHSVLLCALYSDSVMCIREELAPNSPTNLFSRGQRRPLFTGAASKINLPYLPPHQLRILYTRHRKTIATAGLGSDWTKFRAALAQIRRAGFVSTAGEFNADIQGLSAPVFNRNGHILGSLGIAGLESLFRKTDMNALAATVVAAANSITERIGSMDSMLDFPPRAIG